MSVVSDPQGCPVGEANLSVRIGHFFFRHRHILYVPFALAVFIIPWQRHNSIFTGPLQMYNNILVAWLVGLAILLMGGALRLWAVRCCGKRTIYKREGGKWLTMTGPYSHTRNPLYHSNILIGCGLIMFSRLVWLLPVFIVAGYIYYYFVVLYEESRLREQFGDSYQEFVRNVPRWFPRFKAYQPAGEVKVNPWSEVYAAERLRLLAVLVVIFLIMLNNFLVVS